MQNHFKSALIGYTGFVGTTLLKQSSFTHLFRSTNIHEIANQQFNLVICAGASGTKWLANKEPADDLAKITQLISYLKTVQCDLFVLISTVDVFKNPVMVDETTSIHEENLHPYGLHRRILEKFVIEHFNHHLIVRLPGLVGPGLKKNIVFDLLNSNDLHLINTQHIFQYYPMVNLWYDLQTVMKTSLPLIHFTSEPVSVQEMSKEGFGKEFKQVLPTPLVQYDMRSIHDKLLGGRQGYHYNKQAIFQCIRAYAQSESKKSFK